MLQVSLLISASWIASDLPVCIISIKTEKAAAKNSQAFIHIRLTYAQAIEIAELQSFYSMKITFINYHFEFPYFFRHFNIRPHIIL